MGSLSNLYISQSYQSLIHLATNNTASATLIGLEDGLGNSIGVSVNTAGNLFLSGTFSASLQEGYLYVGNASGRTIAFPTSSLVTNINTGSLVTTSSFNAYTASTDIRLSNIELTTASVLVSISNLNASSASQQISIDALNQYTQSNDQKWNNLAGQSGSWITESETGSFARWDVSNPWSADQTFTNITAFSASFTYVKTIFETASVIYSSGSNQLGDELTDIQTLSGSVKVQGSLTVNGVPVQTSSVDISSLNQATASLQAFTQSANIRLNNLETTSASVNISISNLNTFTASISTASIVNSITNLNSFTQSANQRLGSLEAATGSYAISSSVAAVDAAQQQQINSLIAATSSYVTESESGSFLITASFNNGTRNLTFTKGDASTFAVNIPDVSGSTINTGSFATTGSNTFNGNQIITGALDVSGSDITFNDSIRITNGTNYGDIYIDNFTTALAINGANGVIVTGGMNNVDISGAKLKINTNTEITGSIQSTDFIRSETSLIAIGAVQTNLMTTPGGVGDVTIDTAFGLGEINLNPYSAVSISNNLNITGSLTASLQQGYVWVGNGAGRTSLVPTSSFIDTFNSSSLVTTASFNSYTQSNDQRVSSLEAATSSYAISSSVAAVDAAQQAQINSLINATGSYVTETESGSFLITASFASQTLTFTKGDGTTFGVLIPDVSGSTIDTGSFVTTSSFNAYTASNDQRVGSLESNSASVNISISNINVFTQSADQRLDSIEAQSGSWVTSAITASSIITASVSNDDITFTKGDGSQFTIQVATGSYAETASLALNAKDIIVDVKNMTGTQIDKGTVVRIIGSVAASDVALIGTASWENDGSSANTLGFVTADIPHDSFGTVMTQGTLLGIDTDGFTAGQILYLSSSGQYTNVIPPAPYHEVRLGQVLRVQQNNGSMYVLIQNGYELGELHDVDITTGSLANNQVLAYDSASGQWENKTLTEVGAVLTSSFNAYTSSNDQKVNSLIAATGSYAISASVAAVDAAQQQQINSLISATSSYADSASFAASQLVQDGRLNNLESTTASLNTSITNINSFTQSANQRLTAIETVSGSWITESESGSFLITGSVAGNVLTFTKGDNTTFNLTVATGSGGSTDTGSLLLTASASPTANTITFTKGNNTTFDVTLNITASASASINTGSFATTGSNVFYGSQTFNNTPSDVFRINWGSASSASLFTETSGGPNQTLNLNSASLYINRGGLFFSSGSFTVQTGDMQFNSYPSASFTIRTQYGGDAVLRSNSDYTNFNLPYAYFKATPNGAVEITGFGDNITISGSSTIIQGVNFIPFSASLNTRINSITGSATDTGSLLVTASVNLNTITFTKGNNTTFALTVDTGSGGGGTTYTNPTLNPWSGSLILAANTTTTSSFSHITASNNGQVNLMFQNRNLTGQIYITGSSNIFSNPAAPTAGRLNYLGGSSNILLTSFTANNTQAFPSMTGSTATIGGIYPAMNGNILMGQSGWTINTSNNPGIHNYNNNILNGTTTFNMVGNVQTAGVANTGRFDFTGNTSAGTFLINSPSRSLAETAAGATGSFRLSITNNNVQGIFQYNGPVSGSSTNTHNITQNIVAGTVTMNVQSGSKGYTVSGNSINGTLAINDNTAFTPTLGSSVTYTNNIINGSTTFNTRNSGSFSVTNNNINTWTISSDADTSGITTAGNRTLSLTSNILGGQLGNNILYSGSAAGSTTKAIVGNIMAGNLISASVGGSDQSLIGTAVLGHGLQVIGTSILNAGNVSIGGERGGSAFLGRWNALDGTRGFTAETVFAVGTGTSGSTGVVRKTGFLIDSGSNTFIEGTLNVSGSTTITGSLTLSSSAAIELNVIGNSQFTGSLTVSGSTTVTGSVNISNVIQLAQLDPLPAGATGQLAVSQSLLWFYDATQWRQVSLV